MDVNNSENLDQSMIESYLSTDFFTVSVVQSTTSTNDDVKALAQSAKEGLVIIANHQTHGRGRLNRQFISPAHKGIYLSILIKPKTQAFQTQLFPLLCAVAMSEAIFQCTELFVSLKWVNDLMIHHKKIGGILCESLMDANGQVSSLVVGIGINVHSFPFPKDERHQIGCLADFTSRPIHRNQLIATFLHRFHHYYIKWDASDIVSRYRQYCAFLHQKIVVHHHDLVYEATALTIDEQGYLVVMSADQKIHQLISEEISIQVFPDLSTQ